MKKILHGGLGNHITRAEIAKLIIEAHEQFRARHFQRITPADNHYFLVNPDYCSPLSGETIMEFCKTQADDKEYYCAEEGRHHTHSQPDHGQLIYLFDRQKILSDALTSGALDYLIQRNTNLIAETDSENVAKHIGFNPEYLYGSKFDVGNHGLHPRKIELNVPMMEELLQKKHREELLEKYSPTLAKSSPGQAA